MYAKLLKNNKSKYPVIKIFTKINKHHLNIVTYRKDK